MNESRTCANPSTNLTQPRSGPVRYELIDKDGRVVLPRSNRADLLALHAQHLWPDQEQDPERTGKGWDVQVVGAGS